MAHDVNISMLLDIYGNILTNKQRDALELYYNQDLSLAEIAEHHNITRQGVRDSIERGKSYLLHLEKNLNLMKKLVEIRDYGKQIMDCTLEMQAYNKRYLSSIPIAEFGKKIYDVAKEISAHE